MTREWRILVKRERGVYPATCERCGDDGLCRLQQVGDRYLWCCISGCAVHVKNEEAV